MTNAIDSSLFYANAANRNQSPGNVLGKDAFLKILMAQLKNQDPLNPLEDKDFIAQMSTFSQLEQMMEVADSMENLIALQKENLYIGYSSFVGKEVDWHIVEYPEDSGGQPVVKKGTGRIVSVMFKSGEPVFYLEDGTELKPGNISGVKDAFGSSIVEASALIGKKITWTDEQGAERQAVVQSVSVKDGIIYFHMNDDQHSKITAGQIVKIESAG
ncbi:MAG: flagellar hook assembly protein FlgD [Caldibacillus debilis]|uniref:flagellar hook assembly protein FlgD n=1 Tax=Caldibacillus debilis TaxID=301148 RepID=UPI000E39F0C6|nr:flagellar hook assembly protein FlgD [Caldibacillus debilis]REJ15288.1 MAG: flagellar hook assembly protein FlgD [Caldibacillus debilis]